MKFGLASVLLAISVVRAFPHGEGSVVPILKSPTPLKAGPQVHQPHQIGGPKILKKGVVPRGIAELADSAEKGPKAHAEGKGVQSDADGHGAPPPTGKSSESSSDATHQKGSPGAKAEEKNSEKGPVGKERKPESTQGPDAPGVGQPSTAYPSQKSSMTPSESGDTFPTSTVGANNETGCDSAKEVAGDIPAPVPKSSKTAAQPRLARRSSKAYAASDPDDGSKSSPAPVLNPSALNPTSKHEPSEDCTPAGPLNPIGTLNDTAYSSADNPSVSEDSSIATTEPVQYATPRLFSRSDGKIHDPSHETDGLKGSNLNPSVPGPTSEHKPPKIGSSTNPKNAYSHSLEYHPHSS